MDILVQMFWQLGLLLFILMILVGMCGGAPIVVAATVIGVCTKAITELVRLMVTALNSASNRKRDRR